MPWGNLCKTIKYFLTWVKKYLIVLVNNGLFFDFWLGKPYFIGVWDLHNPTFFLNFALNVILQVDVCNLIFFQTNVVFMVCQNDIYF